jgi:hypothetical protein
MSPAKRKRAASPPRGPTVEDLRAAFATADAYGRRVACDAAFGAAHGACLVLGEPGSYVVAGLAAHAAGVVWTAAPKRVRAASRALSAASPVWTSHAPATGDGEAQYEEAFGALYVCELPERDPADALERALGAVADGGSIRLDVPRPAPSDERRIRRLVEAASVPGGVAWADWAPRTRLAGTAVRRAPYPADVADEPPGALPMAVVVVSTDRAAVEEPLADLLARQNLPPSEVFVLDLAVRAADRIPDDLFGLRPSPLTRVALLRKPGEPLHEALNDALSATETPFVALLLPDVARLAPNHLAILGLALEADPAAGAAFSDVAVCAADGRVAGIAAHDAARLRAPIRSVALAGAFPVSAAVWRTSFVRDLGGFSPGGAAELDFRLRAAQRGGFVARPLPTVGLREDGADAVRGTRADRASAVAAAAERESLADAVAETDPEPDATRAARGLLRQARLFAAAGRAEAALARCDEAERRSPGVAATAAVKFAADAGRVADARRRAAAAPPQEREAAEAYAAARRGDAVAAVAGFRRAAERATDPRGALFGAVAARLVADADAAADLTALAAACGLRDDAEADVGPPLFGGADEPGPAPAPRRDERCA